MARDDLAGLAIDRKGTGGEIRRPAVRPGVAVLVALAIVAAAAIAWSLAVRSADVTVASVSRVHPATLLAKLNASGYVVAQRRADVASKVTGRIQQVFVREGSVVEEGQLLARLENEDARAALQQASANLEAGMARLEQARAVFEDARIDYERKAALAATGAVSASELDSARARFASSRAGVASLKAEVRSLESSLRNARVLLSYTEIRAPFSGVVLAKNADVGDIVTPLGAAATAKAAVVSMADLSSMQVEVDVSESNLGLVSAGQPCDIELDALSGEHFAGTVDALVPTVDRSKATVLVKVRFASLDSRILPQMSARVSFLSRAPSPGENAARTMVDARAVVSENGAARAFVVEDGRARSRAVTTGARYADMVEVRSGLQPGETVVVNPEGIRDGMRVRAARP